MLKQVDKFFLESNKQTRIAISISAIGLLLFIVIATLSPFKDQLFNLLYPKPPSLANYLEEDFQEPYYFDQGVIDIIPTNTVNYLGGGFTEIGIQTGSGVTVDPQTGLRVNPYVRIENRILTENVYTAVPDGNGGWYIGGSFTKIGTFTRNRIAHLNADGTLDSAFDPNVDSDVRVLLLSSDKQTLYVGGRFHRIGGQSGQTRNFLAAIKTADGTVTSFDPNPNNEIKALALSGDGSQLYVAGLFTIIGGQTKNRIAAIKTADGSVVADFNPNANWTVNTLALSPNGILLYAGGEFTTIGGQNRNRIAAIKTADGSVVTDFNPDADGEVNNIALSPDGVSLYAGGYFTSIGGQSRNFLAGLETASGKATSLNPSLDADAEIFAIALSPDGTTLYFGGYLAQVNGQERHGIAAVSTADSSLHQFNPSILSGVYTLAFSTDNSKLYIGGRFNMLSWYPRSGVVAVNPSTGWVIPEFRANTVAVGISQDVFQMALSKDGTKLYIGGDYISINDEPIAYFSAVNSTTGEVITSFNLNLNGPVYDMELTDDGTTLYIAGNFTSVGGQTRNRIAAINTSDGSVTDFNPDANGSIYTILLNSDETILYLGGGVEGGSGGFTQVGGQTRNRLASVKTSDGSVTEFNPNANGGVYGLELNQDETILFAGGDFTTMGGQTRNLFAAINVADSSVTSLNPVTAGRSVLALTLTPDGQSLYVGGYTGLTINGSAQIVGLIDVTTGELSSWKPSIAEESGGVNKVAFSPDFSKLYIVGCFAEHYAVYASEILPTPTPSPTPSPSPSPTPTPTPIPAPTPTPTPGSGGGGQGGGENPPPPTQAPIVVPLAPPKTGRG